MRSKFATLQTFCALSAAVVALSAGAQAATPRTAGVKHTVKAPVRVSPAKQPALPIAPWPPARETIGAPILPTQYPNVFVRYEYDPASSPAGDVSIYKMPGAADPVRGMVPRAAQKPFQPVVGNLPGGGKYFLTDPANMDTMVATRDASGHFVVTCVKPAQIAPPKQGGAK